VIAILPSDILCMHFKSHDDTTSPTKSNLWSTTFLRGRSIYIRYDLHSLHGPGALDHITAHLHCEMSEV